MLLPVKNYIYILYTRGQDDLFLYNKRWKAYKVKITDYAIKRDEPLCTRMCERSTRALNKTVTFKTTAT